MPGVEVMDRGSDRKIVMEARTEVIAKVFDKVAEELEGIIESSDYNEILEKLHRVAIIAFRAHNRDRIEDLHPLAGIALSAMLALHFR